MHGLYSFLTIDTIDDGDHLIAIGKLFEFSVIMADELTDESKKELTEKFNYEVEKGLQKLKTKERISDWWKEYQMNMK